MFLHSRRCWRPIHAVHGVTSDVLCCWSASARRHGYWAPEALAAAREGLAGGTKVLLAHVRRGLWALITDSRPAAAARRGVHTVRGCAAGACAGAALCSPSGVNQHGGAMIRTHASTSDPLGDSIAASPGRADGSMSGLRLHCTLAERLMAAAGTRQLPAAAARRACTVWLLRSGSCCAPKWCQASHRGSHASQSDHQVAASTSSAAAPCSARQVTQSPRLLDTGAALASSAGPRCHLTSCQPRWPGQSRWAAQSWHPARTGAAG